MPPEELLTLRIALKVLGKPSDARSVKRLRDRLRIKQHRQELTILTEKPLRITLSALKEHVPELFQDCADLIERRVLSRLYRAMTDRKTGD